MFISLEMIDFAERQSWDEDVKQDVYEILLEKEEGYMAGTKIEKLMTAIYNYRTVHLFRRDARRAELDIEHEKDIRELHSSAHTEDPVKYMEADLLFDRAEAMSPLLARTLRYYIEGYNAQEIAEKEDVDPNVIYARLYKIKRELS